MLSTDEQFRMFQGAQALGELSISSEYLLVPVGFEDMQFLVKQFAIPVVNPEGAIDVPMIAGMLSGTPELAKTYFKNSFALKETVLGHAKKFFENIASERTVSNRAYFDFDLYQGTVENHTNVWHCKKAFVFGVEPLEVDFENRSQLAVYTGQIAYNYFPNVK